MINYSIFPAEMVFEGWEEFEPRFELLEVGQGLTLEVERLDQDRVKISRVISSNPRVYLNSSISPGTILNLSLNILQ
jgi:hypothetical protein